MNKLKVVHDSCAESPREWDNLGTIAYKHSRYTLGEVKINEPIEWLESMLNLQEKGIYSNERLAELESKFFSQFLALPIYLYDHSGQSISTKPFSCSWDSGKVGYIYVDKKAVLSEFGGKKVTKKLKERILNYLNSEVETYNEYIEGNVYGFQIVDEDENIVDSCYGFFGREFETNGMAEHIDLELLGIENKEQLLEVLESAEIEY